MKTILKNVFQRLCVGFVQKRSTQVYTVLVSCHVYSMEYEEGQHTEVAREVDGQVEKL